MIVDIDGDQAKTVQQVAQFFQATEEFVLAEIRSGALEAININTKPGAIRPRWRILASAVGKYALKHRHQVEVAAPKAKRAKSTAKDYFA